MVSRRYVHTIPHPHLLPPATEYLAGVRQRRSGGREKGFNLCSRSGGRFIPLQINPIADQAEPFHRSRKMRLKMAGNGFVNGDGVVAQAREKTREKVDRRGLMDGGHMRNASQSGGLRSDPSGAAGMGVNEVNPLFAHETRDPKGVDDAAGKSLCVNRERGIRLPVMQPVGDPEHPVLSCPRFLQSGAVRFRSRRFQGG